MKYMLLILLGGCATQAAIIRREAEYQAHICLKFAYSRDDHRRCEIEIKEFCIGHGLDQGCAAGIWVEYH